jgi:hypothetical protein
MCFGKWGSRFSEAAGAPGVDTVSNYNALLQAAADGAIPVWGKKQNYGVHEPIPKEFGSIMILSGSARYAGMHTRNPKHQRFRATAIFH